MVAIIKTDTKYWSIWVYHEINSECVEISESYWKWEIDLFLSCSSKKNALLKGNKLTEAQKIKGQWIWQSNKMKGQSRER